MLFPSLACFSGLSTLNKCLDLFAAAVGWLLLEIWWFPFAMWRRWYDSPRGGWLKCYYLPCPLARLSDVGLPSLFVAALQKFNYVLIKYNGHFNNSLCVHLLVGVHYLVPFVFTFRYRVVLRFLVYWSLYFFLNVTAIENRCLAHAGLSFYLA